MAARRAILNYIRLQPRLLPSISRTPFAAVSLNNFLTRSRLFSSDAATGSFLDKDEVTERVLTVVKDFQKVDPSKVTPNAHFQNDLGLDSLDAVEIVMALEEEFGFEIPDNEADKINSINLAVDFIASHPQAK
ncbi:Acyl carrier protein 2, mitochondrial-like protein [Drosera capensis]